MAKFETVEEAAATLHLTEHSCTPCSGTGQREKPNVNAPGGKEIENPCKLCRGYGRRWRLRSTSVSYTDDDLLKMERPASS